MLKTVRERIQTTVKKKNNYNKSNFKRQPKEHYKLFFCLFGDRLKLGWMYEELQSTAFFVEYQCYCQCYKNTWANVWKSNSMTVFALGRKDLDKSGPLSAGSTCLKACNARLYCRAIQKPGIMRNITIITENGRAQKRQQHTAPFCLMPLWAAHHPTCNDSYH